MILFLRFSGYDSDADMNLGIVKSISVDTEALAGIPTSLSLKKDKASTAYDHFLFIMTRELEWQLPVMTAIAVQL